MRPSSKDSSKPWNIRASVYGAQGSADNHNIGQNSYREIGISTLGGMLGCGEVGHVRAKCPTKPSKPLSISSVEGKESNFLEKDKVRD